IDNGSGMCKAGFAGDDAPRAVTQDIIMQETEAAKSNRRSSTLSAAEQRNHNAPVSIAPENTRVAKRRRDPKTLKKLCTTAVAVLLTQHTVSANRYLKKIVYLQHVILDSYDYCTDSLIEDLTKSNSSISIIKLSLRGCDVITDGAIRSLEGLKNLTYLDLNNCKVTDKGLKYIESKCNLYIYMYNLLIVLYIELQHLLYLNLSKTKITNVGILSMVTNAKFKPELQVLLLDGCTRVDSSGILIPIVNAFINLLQLSLGYTTFSKPLEQKLTNKNIRLEQLDVNHTLINDQDLIGFICQFKSLVELKLGGCEALTTRSLSFLPRGKIISVLVVLKYIQFPDREHDLNDILSRYKDLPIEHLDLAGFLNITDEGAKYIAGMKHLRYLSLDGTKVTDEGIMLFENLTELEKLYLDRTLLTDVAIEKLKGLSKLETLSLCRTEVSNVGLCFLGDFEQISFARNLRTLNLAQCIHVTDKGVRGLDGMQNLTNLNLDHTGVSKSCLKYLKVMSEYFFKIFGTVTIVQEVSRPTSPTLMNDEPLPTPIIDITKPISIVRKSSKRKHGRKNSFYALKQFRKFNKLKQLQQYTPPSSFIQIYSKSKSQKLLCLWPLPTITRYTILLSLIISTLTFLGLFDFTCSSPSYVIHHLDITNLLVSPFLFFPSIPSIFIFCWNVLILGLFEESLTHMLGGTRRFIIVLAYIIFSVCTIRQCIGYIFSKSTGWAVPSLFFSDSLHECSQGLAPFLFALVVIQSLNIQDKYILMYGSKNSKFTIRKVTLQIIMCLVNYTVKNILWWSLTGLLTGFIAMIIIQTWLAKDKHWASEEIKDEEDEDDLPVEITMGRYRPLPLWRTLHVAIKKGLLVVCAILPVLLICNGHYTKERLIDPISLNQLSYDRYLFTFVIMTAPRRGNPPFLSRTLDSYIKNWPENPEPGSLYDRIQTIVYTHFTTHVEYDRAQRFFQTSARGQRYLKWMREEGDTLDQRSHVSKALSLAADKFQSTYIALVEDDFPVCGTKEWRKIESVIYAANIESPNHCGVFVGTGGSGLFLKPKIAKLASGLLLKYPNLPPDIIIQQCLLGNLNECRECTQTLVTSKTLLMYHIGYNTSTSEDRSYKKNEFQCGWRHPFNGDPNVITL
ncbi:hypothetical protein INT48_005200, partial [Thamnidium elegans]